MKWDPGVYILLGLGNISVIWEDGMSFVDTSVKCGQQPGPRLNIKTIFPRYGDFSIFKDQTVVRHARPISL